MATKKKATSATKTTGTKVVGASADKSRSTALRGADVVTLRVSLRRGYAMDDIPDGKGSTKTVVLPGLDSALKGQRRGILTPDGNALFVQLPRADWEQVKLRHGKERMFNSYKGFPPCVAEIESVEAAEAGAYKDDIEATVTGYAPADPEKLGVEEAPKSE